jgi:hypothetical protein
MASAGHSSERARHALDIRLVIDAIPHWRGPLVRTAPLTSSTSAGSTTPASRPNRRVIGAGRLPFTRTT